MWKRLFSVWSILAFFLENVAPITPFADCINKPVLPTSVPEPYAFDSQAHGVKKHIPQHMWIAVRNVTDARPAHLAAFMKKNSNWTVHFQGNVEKDNFMETFFANTSTLWYVSVVCVLLSYYHLFALVDRLWMRQIVDE